MSKLLYSERRLTTKIENYFTYREELIMSTVDQRLVERMEKSKIKPGLNRFHNAVAVGLDFANGWAKLDSTILDEAIVYLNTLTVSNQEEYEAHLRGVGREEVFYVDGEYYKIGLAIDNSNGLEQYDFSTRMGRKKYENPLWQSAFKIAVYLTIRDRKEQGIENARIFVTFGLPVNDNKMNSLKEYLKDVLSNGKRHTVNGLEFGFELSFLPQGTAAFFNDLYDLTDENKLVVNKKFLALTAPLQKNGTSRVMIVDGGWGTADCRLFLGNVPQEGKTKELSGMQKVFEEILEEVRKKEEGEFLVSVDLSTVEDQIRDGKEITLNYQTVNIEDEFNAAMRKFSKRLVSELYTGVFDQMAYEMVKFVGGFTDIAKEFLEEAVEEYHKEEGRRKAYKYAKNGQLANCEGYLKYAIAQMQKALDEK